MTTEIRAVFEPPIRPFSRIAPPRSLRPEAGGAIWRETLNLVPREGKLRPRPRLTSMGGLGEVLQPDFLLTAGTNREYPVFVYSGSTTGDVDAFNRATTAVLVTDRQAYIYNSNGWINVTPTYTTGTIAVTNGSTAVVGTGTAWSSRFISAGQHLRIGSTWYQISSVNTDTSITLDTNYTGATGSGVVYEIRRNWKGSDDNPHQSLPIQGLVHCTIYNDNLYIAGTYLGSANGSVSPAVIRVTDILSATPTIEYLTARDAFTAGLDVISDLTEITGIQNLQDGRVVIAGNRSTVFYSSLLLETTWTTSPAGRTIVVGRLGGINALGKLGNNLTLHYDTGITLAYPTGSFDPPLSFQPTPASSGCVSPLTLKTHNGMEYYAGVGGMVFAFDGNSSHPIGQEVVSYLATSSDVDQRHNLTAYVSARWGEYGIVKGSDETDQPNLFIHRTEDGSWWSGQFPIVVGAVSDEDHLSGVNMARRYGLAAVLSRDGNNGAGEIANLKPILWGLDTDGASDGVSFSTHSGGTNYVTTDDLDFGNPLVLKTIHRVLALFLGQSVATQDVSVEVSRDGGATWIGPVTKSLTFSTTDEKWVQFCFTTDTVKASPSYRVRVTCGDVGILTYLEVVALETSHVEFTDL